MVLAHHRVLSNENKGLGRLLSGDTSLTSIRDPRPSYYSPAPTKKPAQQYASAIPSLGNVKTGGSQEFDGQPV